jgi:hypothetical protein
MAPLGFGVVQADQDQGGADTVPGEGLDIGARQVDLPGCGGGLLFLKQQVPA